MNNLSGDVQFQNVIFADCGTAVRCQAAPSRVEFRNVLHLGPGALLDVLQPPAAGRLSRVNCRHVTQRRSTALLAVALSETNAPSGRFTVLLQDCVLHLTDKPAALCLLRTAFPGRIPAQVVRISGEGSLMGPATRIAAEADDSASRRGVTEQAATVEGGLIADPFEFAGSYSGRPADSVVSRHGGPRRSGAAPGIDAALFSDF